MPSLRPRLFDEAGAFFLWDNEGVSVAGWNEEVAVRSNDCATDEGYVALQAWLVGQLDPRTPHAADLFAQDSECLYDAFLSVLIGTGLGFIAYDDDRTHHGLYAFDFFVGDVHAPPPG